MGLKILGAGGRFCTLELARHVMFFRRRKKNPASPCAAPVNHRRLYRAPVPSDDLRARVGREEKDDVQATVFDLSLEGVGIEVPFHLDPQFEPGEVVQIHLRHAKESWVVQTAARVEQDQPDGGANVRYGLTFLNMGNLYAQLEDTLGKYFNRRRHARVHLPDNEEVIVRLRQGGHRPRGSMVDLSSSGMCVALSVVAAASLRSAEPLQLVFELPQRKTTFEGRARVVDRRRLGATEFLSFEFDLAAEGSLVERHGELAAYVTMRADRMAAYSRNLQGSRG